MIPKERQFGFSLVETVIAIGIVSFAMISLLGMIPVGLSTFRNAMNLTVESAIVQSVTGDVLRTDVDQLSNSERWFDEQGNSLEKISENAKLRVYTVKVEAPADLETSEKLGPDETKNLVTPEAAYNVVINVFYAKDDPIAGSPTHRYAVLVPRVR